MDNVTRDRMNAARNAQRKAFLALSKMPMPGGLLGGLGNIKMPELPKMPKGWYEAMARDFRKDADIYETVMGNKSVSSETEIIKEADINIIEPKLIEHKE